MITKFAKVQEKSHGRSIIEDIFLCGQSFKIIPKAAQRYPDKSLGPGIQPQSGSKHDQSADVVDSEPFVRRTERSYVLRR